MHRPRLLGSTAWRPRRCRCSRGTCLSVRPFIFIQLLRRPKGQPGLLLASAACHACSLFVRATRRRGMRVASAAAAVPAWPHSNPGAVQNQSVRPSLRPAIDGLRSLCSAVQCDCRCLLVAVPPDDDGRPLHSSWEKEKPASSCC
jgi:hypothetical protein